MKDLYYYIDRYNESMERQELQKDLKNKHLVRISNAAGAAGLGYATAGPVGALVGAGESLAMDYGPDLVNTAIDHARQNQRNFRNQLDDFSSAVDNRLGTRRRQLAIQSSTNQNMPRYGAASGVYKGSFAKPRKNQQTIESKCLTKGYHKTDEHYGLVSDPHCVYIYHHTLESAIIAQVVVGAIVRELFVSSGHSVNQNTSELVLEEGGGTAQFRILYRRRNPLTGATTPINVDITNNVSFDAIKNSCSTISSLLLEYLRNNDQQAPYSFTLLKSDERTDGTRYKTVAHFDVEDIHLTIPVVSTMMVQNRTAGATATSGDGGADRVDNQPLEGFCYNFSSADPRLKKSVGVNTINFAQEIGLSLFRASEMPNSYNEPPVPKLWQNCVKNVKVRINPGDVKKSMISHIYTGPMRTLFAKMAVKVYDNARIFSHGPGKGQLFAFEETIRTNSSNIVTINYQCEKKIGCFIKKIKRKIPFVTELTSSEVNKVG